MGRGRQKAKHTKIARQLKSFSPNVNYDANESDDEYDYADEDEETGTPKRA